MVDRHVYAVVVVVEGIDGNNVTVKMVIIHRIESMALTMTILTATITATAMTVLTATITAMTIRTYSKKKN